MRRRERLREGLQMSVSDVIAKIVSFLRASYPQGVPVAWSSAQPVIRLGGGLTFLTRTRGPFWSIGPARILLIAVLGTQAIATLIAVYGLFMTPLGWGWATFVWGVRPGVGAARRPRETSRLPYPRSGENPGGTGRKARGHRSCVK
jgi:hypothetical protein